MLPIFEYLGGLSGPGIGHNQEIPKRLSLRHRMCESQKQKLLGMTY
jgi:hypothetical protein